MRLAKTMVSSMMDGFMYGRLPTGVSRVPHVGTSIVYPYGMLGSFSTQLQAMRNISFLGLARIAYYRVVRQ